MERILFIYNPKAGRGQIRARINEIISFYTSEGNNLLTLYPTKSKGDGAKFISSLPPCSFDRIVVAGGDGTFSEIAGKAMECFPDIPLSYIPFGSTNDYALSNGIPLKTKDSLPLSLKKASKRDLGIFNGKKYFVYVAAFGLFTNVTYTTSQNLKNTIGYSAYILEGAKSLFPLPSYKLKVISEEKSIEGKFIAGIISNSEYVGGHKTVRNGSIRFDDGKFEALFIRSPEDISSFVETANHMLSGKFDQRTMIALRSSFFEISGDKLFWNLDGEEGGEAANTKIEVKEKALNLVTEC